MGGFFDVMALLAFATAAAENGGGGANAGGGGGANDVASGGANAGGGVRPPKLEPAPGRSNAWLGRPGSRIAFRSFLAISDCGPGACVNRSMTAFMSRASPPNFPP